MFLKVVLGASSSSVTIPGIPTLVRTGGKVKQVVFSAGLTVIAPVRSRRTTWPTRPVTFTPLHDSTFSMLGVNINTETYKTPHYSVQ